MKRSYVVLVAVLLAGGAAALISSAGSAQQSGERTLTFTEQGAREFETKYSERRASPDDTYVRTARLLAGNQPVGRDQSACTATASNATECRATLFLKEGKIFVIGGTVRAAKTTLGVVGGTGAYIGVRGTMTITSRRSGDLLEVRLIP